MDSLLPVWDSFTTKSGIVNTLALPSSTDTLHCFSERPVHPLEVGKHVHPPEETVCVPRWGERGAGKEQI